jgi:hypothetical protein
MSVPERPDPRATGWPPPSGWPPPGGAPTQREPIDPVADAQRFRDRLRLFLILLLALVVVTQLELPFRLAGLGFGLATAWVAGLMMIQMARHRTGADPGARGWLLVIGGLALTGVLMLMLIAEAVYYPVVSDLERCTAQANTQTAEKACEDASKDRLDRLVDRFSERTDSH